MPKLFSSFTSKLFFTLGMLIILSFPLHAFPFSSDSIEVGEIIILGNSKTKPHIILRELSFKQGDHVRKVALDSFIEVNKNNVFNLHLFLDVNIITQQATDQKLNFIIEVKERFYTIPSLIVELADRSFNEWWFIYKHKLNRVEYGVLLTQQNCRGRNETFTMLLQSGFSQRVFFSYEIPWLAKNEYLGLFASAQMLRNREFVYGTDQNNQLSFYRDDNFVRHRYKAETELKYRKKIHNSHRLNLSYNQDWVADTIMILNPDYLCGNKSKQYFLQLDYMFESNKTDIHFYPQSGHYFAASISKLGLGFQQDMNQLDILSEFDFYRNINKKVYWASLLRAAYSFNSDPSFINAPDFGFNGIYVRTFEYYLVKGSMYFLNRNDLKLKLFSKTIQLEKLPMPKFNRIPFDLYAKLFIDEGYVYDDWLQTTNRLQNKWQLGYGVGLDLVTYYDLVFRIEYGFNNFGDKQLFLHINKAI
ncbi:POTRA domain-containing protein [Bacteroidota bacterium]